MLRSRVRVLRQALHLLEAEMEGFDVRAAVLLGSTRAVVWDTLAHPHQVTAVAALAHGLPLTVVYSHADWDHAWGTGGLGSVEQVVAHEAALQRFEADVPKELERRRASEPETWKDVRLLPPTRTFRDALLLDLGGLTLEMQALPGHTPDSIVGFVPEWRTLLAGDAVERPLPVVNDPAAVPAWVERLERWLADGHVETVIPAHGSVAGPDLLADTVRYLRALMEGRDPPVAAHLPRFYRDTHAENVRMMR